MSKMEHLHRILLMMMDELNRVCEENDIKYTVIGGTMLGAVRHGGFIPWDDDIDVAMTRENYDAFLQYIDQFDKRYFVQTNASDCNYYYGFAKLLLKNTCCIESGHENTTYKKGIFIDIFPLDNTPSKWYMRKRQKVVNIIIQKILRQKMKIGDSPSWGIGKKIVFKLIAVVSRNLNAQKIYLNLEKNMKMCKTKDAEFLTSLSGSYGYEKETLPIELFDEYEKIKFEDRYYMSIKNRETYLRSVYGDYMTLPPLENRVAHKFFKLDFGSY